MSAPVSTATTSLGPPDRSCGSTAATADVERTNLRLALSGDDGLVWGDEGDRGKHGVNFIRRQADCLGGGSTEMARNLISERILGMPREMAADKDIPYSDVRHNASR